MHPVEIASQKDLNLYLEREEGLKKTVTLSDLGSGGRLARAQAAQFFDLSVDKAKSIKETTIFNKILTDRYRGEVDMFDLCSDTVRGATEHDSTTATSCTTDAREPTYGKFNWDLVKLAQDWKISWEAVQENIEKEGIRAAINSAMATNLMNNLEKLFFRGDVATYSAVDPATHESLLLKQLDGIVKQALDCTSNVCGTTIDNVITGTGQYVTRDHFAAVLSKMSDKYADNTDDLVYIAHPRIWEDYKYYLGSLGTDLGDAHKDGTRPEMAPLGIKRHEAPWMPVDKTGTNNYILLTTKRNLWYAIHRTDIRRYSRHDQHCDAYFYTNYFHFDCGIRDCEALAIIKGIALRSSSSFTI